MATIVIKAPDGSEQEQEVSAELSIGRSEGNDLILSEGGVSRQHARFFVEAGNLCVEDSGSANGTWVDGERIDASVTLSLKSQIVIGDYELTVKSIPRPSGRSKAVRGEEKSESRARGSASSKAPRATGVMPVVRNPGPKPKRARPASVPQSMAPVLKGLMDPIAEAIFPLKGLLKVGRVQRSDIQIEDDSVSRTHAEVEVRGKEVFVRDLGSANGTQVNGEPVTDDVALSHGDVVQFGMIELMFETGASKGAGALARRPSEEGQNLRSSSRPSGVRGASANAAKEPAAASPRRKLVLVAAAVAGLLVVAAVAKLLLVSPPPPPPPSKTAKVEDELPADPAAEIEQLLAAARSYSASEFGEPQWDKAEAALKRVLELEPIQGEANEMKRRIDVERKCQASLLRGNELASLTRFVDALEAYEKVTPNCNAFFLKALEAAREPIDNVKKRSASECKTYASNGKWEAALTSCESYARLACQTMAPTDLQPPLGAKLKLEGALKKTDWRPKDLLFVNFLKARAKLKPNDPPWACPELLAFRPAQAAADPSKEIKDELMKAAPEPSIGRALVAYYEGQSSATVPIQKMRLDLAKTKFHEIGFKVQQDIDLAFNLLQKGNGQLSNDKLENAEKVFVQALEIDEKIMLGDAALLTPEAKKKELSRKSSWLRKQVVQGVAEKALSRSKDLLERKDYRQACRAIKIGLAFNRSYNDLLAAALACTNRAGELARTAGSCEEIKSGLDFAVDGDGNKEKLMALAEDKGCQP